MKNLILIALMAITLNISAQINLHLPKFKDNKSWYYKKGAEVGLMFISGVAYGYNQLDRHHYAQLKAKHPNLNESFWGAEQWRNKWKNGDPAQGERFWQSSRMLVIFTDAHHSTMAIDHAASFSGLLIGQSGMKKKAFWKYVVELGILYVARGCGFALVNKIYR